MHSSILLAVITALSTGTKAGPAALDTRQSCSTSLGNGNCQSTSSCGGFVATGACPGGSTNLCCINKSCSTSKGTGICKNTSYGCSGGSFVSGACPGGSDIQCCVTSNACSTPLGKGSCQSTSSCGGFVDPGYCPGGSTNMCCIKQSCSTSKGTGICKNTSYGCSGGSFIAGACPGGSDIQCCVASSSGGGGGGGGSSCGSLPGLNSVQSAHACAIIAVVKKRSLGRQGCLAALSTGVVESSIRVLANNAVPASLNYAHDGLGSDHDSIGIFQQRASIYTNIAADMDPAASAGQFFDKMVKISGWQTMDVGKLCQAVQVSALPDKYDDVGLPVAKPACSAAGF